jgi:hypothetical protein
MLNSTFDKLKRLWTSMVARECQRTLTDGQNRKFVSCIFYLSEKIGKIRMETGIVWWDKTDPTENHSLI